MKAVFIGEKGELEVRDITLPSVGDGDILVKMMACGICGTDIEKLLGVHITPPRLGHEVSGIIEDVGKAVKGLHVGEHVYVHHHVPCYACHYCRHGDYTMCEVFPKTNLDPCGLAEYFRVPRYNVERGAVLEISEEISFNEGTLIEPFACCIRGLNKVQLDKGDDALVLGAGPMGLIMIGLLRLYGAKTIISSEILSYRLKAAGKMGAQHLINPVKDKLTEKVLECTDGRGVDLAIVAAGGGKLVGTAADCVRRGGEVLMFGTPPRGDILTYDASKLFIKEISLIPSYSTTEIETNAALRLLESKQMDIKWIISHKFKLRQVAEALRVATEGSEALKVIVNP